MLNWRTVTEARSPKFLVKGTELSTAIYPGYNSRFQICEVRSYDADHNPDRIYQIRDAETISNNDIKNGVRPKIIASFDNFDCLDEIIKMYAK